MVKFISKNASLVVGLKPTRKTVIDGTVLVDEAVKVEFWDGEASVNEPTAELMRKHWAFGNYFFEVKPGTKIPILNESKPEILTGVRGAGSK